MQQNKRLTAKMSAKVKSPGSAASRLQECIRRDEICEAYEFESSYDGTVGKETLIFRESMFNYYDDARIDLGPDFNQRKLVRNVKH